MSTASSPASTSTLSRAAAASQSRVLVSPRAGSTLEARASRRRRSRVDDRRSTTGASSRSAKLPRLALVESRIDGGALGCRFTGVRGVRRFRWIHARPTREVVVWSSTVPRPRCGTRGGRLARRGARRFTRGSCASMRPHERRCNPRVRGRLGCAHACSPMAIRCWSSGEPRSPTSTPACRRSAGAALPMNRFRPNLVLSGLARLRRGPSRHDRSRWRRDELVKPCTRCVTTTTDQATAARGIEPLPTLGPLSHERGVGRRDVRDERDRHRRRRA